MLPSLIPIFPLSNVVLFPNVFLPLHIFEPRYRDMVRDALSGDRLIGMVLLKPEGLHDYEGRPPVYPIGCAGTIRHAERLQDGRFNIILRGLEKFQIVGEEHDRSYRRAHIQPIGEHPSDIERQGIQNERRKLEALLKLASEQTEARLPGSIADEDLVNTLAQYLELEPLEKQALLEREGPLARCLSLVDLLEMKVMVARGAIRSEWAH